jgi:hypothetical protein
MVRSTTTALFREKYTTASGHFPNGRGTPAVIAVASVMPLCASIVNGRLLKARNQWYNRRMKELKLRLPKKEQNGITKQYGVQPFQLAITV